MIITFKGASLSQFLIPQVFLSFPNFLSLPNISLSSLHSVSTVGLRTYFRKWSYFLTKFCQLVSIFNTNDINSEPIAEIILPPWNHLIRFVYPYIYGYIHYMRLILADPWRLREGPLGLAVKRWNITCSKAENGQNWPWMLPFVFKQF